MSEGWRNLRQSVQTAVALLTTVSLSAVACEDGREPPAEPILQMERSPVIWHEPIEITSGAAYVGPWRMNESEWHYVDDPSAALGDDGTVALAWVNQSERDVFFQLFEPDGTPRLAEPVNVSRSSDVFSWLPRLVLAPTGEVYVLWQEIVFSGGSHGGEIFFSRSRDGGKTFSEPLNLSNTIAGAGKGRITRQYWYNGSLDLVMSGEELFAAWTEYEGRLWFSRSADGGETFSDPVLIAGTGDRRPARGPSLAAGAGRSVFLVWAVGEDPSGDLYFTRSRDGGRSFDASRTVVESAGHSEAPKIAVDGDGTLHLAWGESPAGPFLSYHVRYARSTDGGDTFEEPTDVSAAHADEFVSLNFPALRLDGEGRLYVLWECFSSVEGRPRGLGFTISRDGGRSFSSPTIVPGTGDPEIGFNGSLQGLLMSKLAVNASGDVAVVNSTFRPERASRVWLIRGHVDDR